MRDELLVERPPQEEKEERSWVHDLWLDSIEVERRALIMRLRQYDKILIASGRLSEETLPRRER